MAMLMRYETVSDVPTSRQDHPQSLRVHLKAAGIEFIGAPEDRSRIRIGRSW